MSSTRGDQPRILIFIKGLGLGGAERLIADSAPAWDRERYDYAVAYVLPWKDQLVAPLEQRGATVTCVGGSRGLGLAAARNLRSLVRTWKPDIVHAHLPSAGILARILLPQPVVYTEHNIASSYRQPTKSLNRLTYGRNRSVIAVSTPVAESLAGFPGPEPLVIENGISVEMPDDVESVRHELGIDLDCALAVHVGNIRPHKGHSNLIAATADLAQRRDEFQIVSIGAEKHDGDLDRVRSEAQAAGVTDHIRFLGRRDDARRFLAAADVVVNPSDVEGLPVTLLEALSFARPVVATDVGGVSRVVIDQQTGLLVPPADPAALAEGIDRAMSDPVAPRWGQEGQRLIRSEFSIERMVRAQERLYEEILGG